MKPSTLVRRLESYLASYLAFPNPHQALVVALWIVGTWVYKWFDAYPYLVITAATKRSGKTRLAELIGFAGWHAKPFAAMTPATMFRAIGAGATILFDEAESLSSESAGVMRSVLNVGYRRGQTIPRIEKGEVKEFEVYCPKAFVLIGDVYDTLKDRSIVIELARGVPAKTFVWADAESDGRALGAEIEQETKNLDVPAADLIDFLSGREAEIWAPLFALCKLLCPSRLDDLTRAAADFAALKTADTKRYTSLKNADDAAADDTYARQALADLTAILSRGSAVAVSTDHAVTAMKQIATAPWRTYRGGGLTPILLANLLSRFGVTPKNCRFGKRADNTVKRGYRRDDVRKALAHHLAH